MSFDPTAPVSTALSVPLLTFPYVAPTGTDPVAAVPTMLAPPPVTNEPGGAVQATAQGESAIPSVVLWGGVGLLAWVLLRKR